MSSIKHNKDGSVEVEDYTLGDLEEYPCTSERYIDHVKFNGRKSLRRLGSTKKQNTNGPSDTDTQREGE